MEEDGRGGKRRGGEDKKGKGRVGGRAGLKETGRGRVGLLEV